MCSDKELLIATKTFARERLLKSWWVLASTMAAWLATFAICISDFHPLVRAASSFIGGLLIVRLFIIYHDYQHSAILSRSPVAGFLLNVYGLLVLSPPSVWNRSHDHHHKHNSKDSNSAVGSFPVMTSDEFRTASALARWQYFVARHPITILFGYLTVFCYGMCIHPLIYRPRMHLDALLALGIHAGLVIGLAMVDWQLLLFGLVLPMTIACAAGSYLFYAQHNFPNCQLENRHGWTHVHAALKSSSYIKMSGMMNWFTGNIGLHHIHHLNARIPFYRLPEAMAGLKELQKPVSSTLRPGDIVACFRANLWDEAMQRFVSYREARRVA